MSDNDSITTATAGDDINNWGKFLAGLLLVTLTLVAVIGVIAYWPNKMPPLKDSDDGAWYTRKWFNVVLIEKPDSCNDSVQLILAAMQKNIAGLKDTIAKKGVKDSTKDSTVLVMLKDSLVALEASEANLKKNLTACCECAKTNRIHLNTILLILVALMGFLGNMVHLASSFTAFVGNGSFKRSWVLWYCVKPFTAAGLAIIVYFIIRAGFLSYGSGAGGISLYGILALSAFTGLFTDSATLKLKEVFEVIFKPKDDRQDKLTDPIITITGISPESIPQAGDSTILLKGTNLDTPNLKITFDGTVVNGTNVTRNSIEVKYTPAPSAKTAGKTVLVVSDGTGKSVFTKDIPITA